MSRVDPNNDPTALQRITNRIAELTDSRGALFGRGCPRGDRCRIAADHGYDCDRSAVRSRVTVP